MRADELRPQADLAASTKVPELAMGTWIYDGQERLFLLDAVSFEFFGFAADAQQGLTEAVVNGSVRMLYCRVCHGKIKSASIG